MKKLLVLLFFIGSMLNAQINKIDHQNRALIGKIGAFGATHITCEKQGNIYFFTYQDVKFQHIEEYKSFYFEDVNNNFSYLYSTIKKGLDSPPKAPVYLKIPEGYIFLEFVKSLGKPNVRIGHSLYDNGEVIGYSVWLTKRKVEKLFGKK